LSAVGIVLAAPVAAADDGGTPADPLILTARNEVANFTALLSGATGVTPELQSQADTTLAALRDARTITTKYPCPADATACRTVLSTAHDATGAVLDDVETITGPGADWDVLVLQYTANATAFNDAWDDFRIQYGRAQSDDAGLSAAAGWSLVAAAVVVSVGLTFALSRWARRSRPPADDRVVTARRALVSASTMLTFALIGATLIVLVVDGFDAPPTGRASGKAALVMLLVPVAVLNLLWATGRYVRATRKFGRTAASPLGH